MIKKYRKLRGYTQEQLAELLDINVRQLQKLEDYTNNPRFSNLVNIAQILDIPYKEIGHFVKDGKAYFDNERNNTK